MFNKHKKPDWNQIYQTEVPKLIGICRRYVKDRALAEDLVHEALMKAIDKLDSFKGTGKFNAWLRQITINEALMHLRKNTAEILSTREMLPEEQEEPDELLMLSWSIDELLEAIDSLPTNYRLVFNLHVLDRYKHKQIAELLRISENTSKSLLLRARIKLQDKLQDMAHHKKRRKSFLGWLFLGSSSPIDQLFRQKFQGFRLAPQSKALTQGAPMTSSTAPAAKLVLWGKLALVAASAIGVALLIHFNRDQEQPQTSVEKQSTVQLSNSKQTRIAAHTSSPSGQLPYTNNYSPNQNQNNEEIKNNSPQHATFPINNIIEADDNVETRLKTQQMTLKQSLSAAIIASSLIATPALASAKTTNSSSKPTETTAHASAEKNNKKEDEKTANVRKSRVKPAQFRQTAQASFLYPIGSSGTQTANTEYRFSFHMLSGITHSIKGFELAGISNINKGHMQGLQIGGIFNHTAGQVRGMQLGGVYNYTNERLKGLQIGGIFNYANWDAKGMQLAGVMNYTGGEMNGMQLSLINCAKTVRGFQLGIVNLGDSISKNSAALGLISIYKHGGYREFELFASDYLLLGINFKLGSKRLYTIYSAGYNKASMSQFAFGVGLGTIIEAGKRFWIQPELYTYTYNQSMASLYNNESQQSHRIKLGLRYNITPHWGIMLAPSLACNLYKTEESNISKFSPIKTWENKQNPTVELTLGASFGLTYCW